MEGSFCCVENECFSVVIWGTYFSFHAGSFYQGGFHSLKICTYQVLCNTLENLQVHTGPVKASFSLCFNLMCVFNIVKFFAVKLQMLHMFVLILAWYFLFLNNSLLLPSSVQFQLASSVELSLALILVITRTPPTHPRGKYIWGTSSLPRTLKFDMEVLFNQTRSTS